MNKDCATLWIAFKAGEKEAFSELFFAYYSKLYDYGLRLVNDEELVKDVIQDFFLKLSHSRAGLSEEVSNLDAYLLASFRRRLLRGEIRRRKVSCVELDQHVVSDQFFTMSPEEITIKKECADQNKKVIAFLLNELPPRQREILYLKYYHNLSLQEIGDTLSISYQVVANQLYRAIKKLKMSDSTLKMAHHLTF